MESSSEIVLEIEEDPADKLPVTDDQPTGRALPFSFANRHGVLIREISGGVAHAVYRIGSSPLGLAEARRFVGMPLMLTRVAREAFDRLLQQTYEQGNQMAKQMVRNLDEKNDL